MIPTSGNPRPAVAIIPLLVLLAFAFAPASSASRDLKYDWKIQYTNLTRLCRTKTAVTVNGLFPGPTIHLTEGDRVSIKVTNLVAENVTIHWHGVKQILSAWADGPAYITQCPIRTGASFTYVFRVIEQRGTLFWHAHISWLRSTLYGAFIIHPKKPNFSPYVPRNAEEKVIILGDWWNIDTEEVIRRAIVLGGRYNASDAYTINGQPGPLYNCSSADTPVFEVQKGRTYLLRIINAGINSQFYFAVANHTLTVVEHDAEYLQPFETGVILVSSGQTFNVLLNADRAAGSYAIASSVYQPQARIRLTTTVPATAILHYKNSGAANASAVNTSAMPLPTLPAYTNSTFENEFGDRLRSLPGAHSVPQTVDESLLFTVGYTLQNCTDCVELATKVRMGAGVSNFGFVHPTSASILEALYYNLSGVYEPDFPDVPAVQYNYTSNLTNFAAMATKVKVLEFGANVQLVLQDTGTLFFESHPMHLHGQNFFVVGAGVGTYDPASDPARFNLVDPPSVNTVAVPFGGWTAIRFQANNPGAWFLHCHIEIHISLGMGMAFVTKNGNLPNQTLGPPPADLPHC